MCCESYKTFITIFQCFKFVSEQVSEACIFYRFEQGIGDTLILADVVLEQFCEDFPLIDEVYVKSDNAGSYHRNCCFEVFYNIDIADLQK